MHYYEYWSLKKAPFDNVPDPSMYVSSHTSSENAIAETLFAVEEGNECLAVIVGDVGLGKTMSLRMVIDSLNPDKYKIAYIVNPDMSFIQLLREIIGQLTGERCELKKKTDLLEAFNKLLFDSAAQGKKVVVFVDEANAMTPSNLEKMRLLTNLQPDEVNLFTIVLAGQLEFAKRLAHPKRANLFQRIGTYCTVEKIGSRELVKNYVETRLGLAGGTQKIFTDDAIDLLWEYSEHGVPRLINKICKLSLKAGETNGFREIGGEVVSQVAERFQRLNGHVAPKKTSRIAVNAETVPEPISVPVKENVIAFDGLSLAASRTPKTEPDSMEESLSETKATMQASSVLAGGEDAKIKFDPEPQASESGQPEAAQLLNPESERDLLAEMSDKPRIEQEIEIDRYQVNVNIPPEVIDEFNHSTEEHCVKLAGVLAAQTMQRYPRLTAAWGVDPLAIWSEIREVILARLRQGQNGTAR
ncbi:MAG: hypothetical protein A4E57_00955 [Syntrophorhabdaceae bacterium PtaU1.Bin034]|nr:MAG: hypothetical protein A4E57_00955 [Syntrophorhabdaceae bacterium PtaU1.Bin034]